MSLRYDESPGKGGFTVVFRLARNTASRDAQVFTFQRAGAQEGFARSLIADKRAESVLGSRRVFADDPVLRGLYVAQTGNERDTREALERLQSDDGVELAYVAPPRDVLIDRTTFVSGDGESDDEWRAQIKLDQAQALPQWKVNERISVAVLDSGIDDKHPQLAHMNFVEHLGRLPPRPDVLGHGSHVAGLIAAAVSAGNGFTGIATDCVDLTMHRGLARPHDVAGYYRALRAAASARIINLSVGGEGDDPTETELVQDALNEGKIIISAMGNSRDLGNPTIYPAALEGVIAVGAVDAAGNVAEFSCYGDHIMLAAPGVGILSTVPTYPIPDLKASGTPPLEELSGTSMATPIVTAVVARMLAYKPSLTRVQVIDLIKTKLRQYWDPDLGHGILNAHALLMAL
jgi:Subtilase family